MKLISFFVRYNIHIYKAVARFLLLGVGAGWGHINLSQKKNFFSVKVDKTSLNFKILQNVLKGCKVNFNYVANKQFFIFKNFCI